MINTKIVKKINLNIIYNILHNKIKQNNIYALRELTKSLSQIILPAMKIYKNLPYTSEVEILVHVVDKSWLFFVYLIHFSIS